MTLSSGLYRIISWPGTEGPEARVLTAGEQGVTVVPPGAAPEREQQFSVEVQPDGTCAIQIPARLFPSRSLSYKEPEAGERVILGPLSDFPTREWRLEPAPQSPLPTPYFIRVPDKDLLVVVSPKPIYPPVLELAPFSSDLQHAWALVPVKTD
ncbi:hypothetical protein [Streptomyces sp. NRRL S-495]|uniref:hypothetical protein n=1 Tax=Streptomyces sp. NRRL S-495 TaxID=1609133 RepID=UPI0005F91BD4|nr:hypothetical protein [Streptomyces sp. NRRL S-495]KJY32414.1 hypothetical protein VR45_22665 [Streptomyces sp. NRRL S-495]